jgi:hypothetical protein
MRQEKTRQLNLPGLIIHKYLISLTLVRKALKDPAIPVPHALLQP